jgi:hypothetical protein
MVPGTARLTSSLPTPSQRELACSSLPDATSSREEESSLGLRDVLVASVWAQAQTQPPEGGRREVDRGRELDSQVADSCKTELQQLCQGQRGQQADQCLRNNESKLSSQCKGAISRGPRR